MTQTVNKISDIIWEIPKDSEMNVPTRVYADASMLEAMKQDRTLDQGRNISTLPGIQKYGIVLPDGHEGYGFPIGGVAALSTENGGVSPGGIGYDINCLCKDSKILTDLGYFKRIQDFEQDFTEVKTSNSPYILKTIMIQNCIYSFDIKSKSFESSDVLYFMKRKVSENILKITTQLGYTIKVTEDHPILTNEGMIPAKKLSNQSNIAIYPFNGVEFTKSNTNSEIIQASTFNSNIQSELIKKDLLPLEYSNEKIGTIAKLFGYLLGAGCIHFTDNNGFVHAYGSNEDLQEIQKDFRILGYSADIYHRVRNQEITTQYGTKQCTTENETSELHIPATSLGRLFVALGYPLGSKTSTEYTIPEWIMDAPLWIKRLFLSGLFGAGLSIPSKQTKTSFYCPIFFMNKNDSVIDNARLFCTQIIKLLEEFGVAVNKIQVRKEYKHKKERTSRVRIQISDESENLIRLWSKIGFSYNKKRSILSQIYILYIKEKLLETEKRNTIQIKIKEYKKKGLKLQEIKELLKNEDCNERFIERHYCEKAGKRLPITFIPIDEYIDLKKAEIDEYGFFTDQILSITKEPYNNYVYDLNIADTHSFIANNIVVSNCGVRLLSTNLQKKEIYPSIQNLLDQLFDHVPAGLGSSNINVSKHDLNEVLNHGTQWAVENGYGTDADIAHCEENGQMKQADASLVSDKAKSRGKKQLATLGSGNHFLEVQYVDEIFDEQVAKTFGITAQDQVMVSIHCGSRGLGHQVCSDYLRKMEKTFSDMVKTLPDRELIYAPASHELCEQYLSAMSAGANFAWCNRHIIGHQVRNAFSKVFDDVSLKTVYDIAHNIAKKEMHKVNGSKKEVYLHRKGATRAFGPGEKEIPDTYRVVGQPVIIPGSMGTASYVLVGTQKGMETTFGSAPHGAGRRMSRHAAKKQFRGEQVTKELEDHKIYVKSGSWKGIAEEAPGVYKDVEQVVAVSHQAGIGSKVARLRPIGVVKG